MVAGPPRYEWGVSPSKTKKGLLTLERVGKDHYRSIVSVSHAIMTALLWHQADAVLLL
jgi:hypothetical protein